MNFRNPLLIAFCFLFQMVFSQNEANNWYFGHRAGITFNAGVPSPVAQSEIFTDEGCSSYSDAAGNLLFYSDGITVWNRNHVPMPNGLGLGGNPTSTQSGLVVPNPDDDTIYYLFTVGAQIDLNGIPPNAGFKYYTIDMTVDGGLGDVIGGFVNLSDGKDEFWSEKVTSVQNTDCDGFWVISFVQNTFYSYLVSNTGVSSSPVISTIPFFPLPDEDGLNRRGYLKASPGGTKLVSSNTQSGLFIFDFDASTGVITNGRELELETEDESSYGVEFSLNGRMLYISIGEFSSSEEKLYQFEITSDNINDINESRNLIYTYQNARGALQLAANGKIYWASSGNPYLSVINNPDSTGSVGFDFQGIDLGGQNSTDGLPPFLQSLFIADLDLVQDGSGILSTQLDLCNGETWTIGPDLSIIPSGAIYTWTLDGVDLGLSGNTTSLFIDETGTYGAGFYELEVDYQDGSCLHRGIALVTFRDDPNLEPLTTIVQCDDDDDGMSLVNLNSANESILIDELTDQIFSFHFTPVDAIAGVGDLPVNFTTGNITLWVRVENRFGCFAITQLSIEIQRPTITSFNQTLRACDDLRDINGNTNNDNDDTDGISFFNFEDPDNDASTPDSILDSVISLFPIIDQPNLAVHFYHSISDALLEENEILNIVNYRNIDSPFSERIFIRVTDNLGLSCPGFGVDFYIDLIVIPIPEILLDLDENDTIEVNGCDDDGDGLFEFDLNFYDIETFDILGASQLDVTLTYFFNDGTPVVPSAPDTLPDPFITDTQAILVKATNNALADCETGFIINFFVGTLPVVNIVPLQTACDDGENDQDGIANFDTSLIQDIILGGSGSQPNVIVTYRDENLNELPSPLPDPFETHSQIITVDVENPSSSFCNVSTTIEFKVNITPQFNIDDAVLCLNELPAETTINIENAIGIYDYNWFHIVDNVDLVVGSNVDFLTVTERGEYKVIATTTDGNFCRKEEAFTVIESNEATLESVFITDTTFSNSSSIIIQVLGEGDYEYALDIVDVNDDDEYQDSNVFNFISFGLHTITIRDKNGCGLITEEFIILEFQKFFTPNDDGLFERWNLSNVDNLFTTFNAVSNVTIFDRFGKVMAVIDPNGEGWDGKFQGQQAVPTDYWFTVDLIDFNGKITTKRGHFSLRL